MLSQEEYRLEENIKRWNIFFLVLFVVLSVWLFRSLEARVLLPFVLSSFDVIILVFALFRIIRLLAYDNIMLFLREFFLDVKSVKYVETGEEHVERVLSVNAFKRTMWKLLNCPWCLGIWVSLFGVFIFVAFPDTFIIFLVLALSGVASLLQIFANFLGWSAEQKKVMAQKNIDC